MTPTENDNVVVRPRHITVPFQPTSIASDSSRREEQENATNQRRFYRLFQTRSHRRKQILAGINGDRLPGLLLRVLDEFDGQLP